MKVLALSLALVGCQKTLDLNGLPVEGTHGPGAGGGGGGTKVDAHTGTFLDAPANPERVCLTTDARMLTACAATGAGGFIVTLGTQSASTNADGTFALTPPLGINTWVVTGTAIVTSEEPYTPTFQIPALSITTFQDLESTNGVIQSSGQGSLFVSVVHGNSPLAGATASVSPAAQFATFYDGANANAWTTSATGAFGVAWMAGITAGTVTVTVTPPSGTGSGSAGGAQVIPGIPVGSGANTFLTVAM